MTPVKVTAVMAGEVAGDVPMLDSLMEWCMSRHFGGRGLSSHADDPSRASVAPGSIPSPIHSERVDGFPWPIPRCSSPILLGPGGDRHDHYAKRLDLSDPSILDPAERRVIYSNMGEFKGYRLPLRCRLAERVVWFAVAHRAPRDVLKELRRAVFAIGKMTKIGYGRVGEWRVEPVADDWSWFAPGPAGERVLMRPLPLGIAEGSAGSTRFFGGLVPPYWDARYFADGVRPC